MEGRVDAEWALTANRYEVSFRGNENLLSFYYDDGCTTL